MVFPVTPLVHALETLFTEFLLAVETNQRSFRELALFAYQKIFMNLGSGMDFRSHGGVSSNGISFADH